jgi:hypothetical protein
MHHYENEWEIIDPDVYKVPSEDLSALVWRRKYMQRYGESLAVELLSIYKPGTHEVSYQVDPPAGIMKILFAPRDGAMEYYGIKDTPKEYEADVKIIMQKVALQQGRKLNSGQFSLIEYRKDPETKISTVMVKLDLVEENRNVTTT